MNKLIPLITFSVLLLVPLPAHANIFIIDDFENDDSLETCDFFLTTGSDGAVQTGIVGVIDLIRECMLTINVEDPPSGADIELDQTGNMFRHFTESVVETTVMLIYDGETLPGNGRSLGLDLTNSDDLRIVYSLADFQVDVTAQLVDSDGDFADLTGILVGGTVSPTELLFPLADFVVQNAALNLADIDEINVTLVSTTFDLDLIDITMQMIGGEIIPIDSTALLLAGAQTNLAWIIPIALSAIGIGVILVKKKF